VTKASDNLFPGIVIRESANDGSDFSNPSADYRRVFVGEDGGFHSKDSAGTVTDIGPGIVATFTPTWTSSGTQPTIGNGSISGWSQKVGDKLYFLCVELVIGSTTTVGTGTYVIGNLPFTAKATSPTFQVITAYWRDAGTTSYAGQGRIAASATSFGVVFFADTADPKQWSATVPVAPASTDSLTLQGVLMST
jgi:hypothetical protein